MIHQLMILKKMTELSSKSQNEVFLIKKLCVYKKITIENYVKDRVVYK